MVGAPATSDGGRSRPGQAPSRMAPPRLGRAPG